MRSRDRRASDATRGWSAGTASLLDRLDFEVRVVAAGGVAERSLRRQRRLTSILTHDIALLEWVRCGRDLRRVGPVQRLDVVQDVAQLVAVAGNLFRRNPQPCQSRDVLDFAGRKLSLRLGQDL